MQTDNAFSRHQPAKKTPQEIQAFYEARIAQEAAALASTLLPSLRERHESAMRRWQALLNLHLSVRRGNVPLPTQAH